MKGSKQISTSKCIFILGMHRSGTSALAGACHTIGMNLGKNLLQKSKYNPKGYFENEAVLSLNEEILEAINSNWYSSPKLDLLSVEEKDTFISKIEHLITTNYSNTSFFVIKDPRLCHLLPLWQQALDNLTISKEYIIIIRSPNEVALSLYNRNNFESSKSQLIYSDYLLQVEKNTRDHQRIIVEYKDLLVNPIETISQLCKAIGYKANFSKKEINNLNLFIDTKLNHAKKHNLSKDIQTEEYADYSYHLLKTIANKKASDQDILSSNLVHQFVKGKIYFPLALDRVINKTPINLTAQLYIDTGFDFRESDSITKDINYYIDETTFSLASFSDIKRLRFDPCRHPCLFQLNEINITSKDDNYLITSYNSNALWENNNVLLFDSTDPNVLISLKEIPNIEEATLTIKYSFLLVGIQDTQELINHYSMFIEDSRAIRQRLQELSSIKNQLAVELEAEKKQSNHFQEKLTISNSFISQDRKILAKLTHELEQQSTLSANREKQLSLEKNEIKQSLFIIQEEQQKRNEAIDILTKKNIALKDKYQRSNQDHLLLQKEFDSNKKLLEIEKNTTEKISKKITFIEAQVQQEKQLQLEQQRKSMLLLKEKEQKIDLLHSKVEKLLQKITSISLENQEKSVQINRISKSILETEALIKEKEQRIIQQELLLGTRKESIDQLKRTIQIKEATLLQKNDIILSKQTSLDNINLTVQQLEKTNKHHISINKQLQSQLMDTQEQLKVEQFSIEQLQKEKQLLEQQLLQYKATLAEKEEALKSSNETIQHQQNLLELKEQETVALSENEQAIKSSLSYRIGFNSTYPFRWIYDRFFNINADSKWWLFGKIFSSGVKNPVQTIKQITPQNIKTLKNAIGNESPEQIAKNFEKKVDLPKPTPIETLQLVEDYSHETFVLTPDDAGIIDKKMMLLRGWAIAKEGIEKIEVYYNNHFLGRADYGQNRPDVANAYPDFNEADQSGFYFKSSDFDYHKNEVTLRVIKKNNQYIDYIVPLKESIDYSQLSLDEQYQVFLEKNKLTDEDISHIHETCKNFDYQPKISIIVPVYNVDPKWLDLCIQSVLNQYYTNWELCLHDDKSTKKETIKCLKKWKKYDKRIKVSLGRKNGNISYASNQAIKLATGEFVALLDNDDELTPDALYENVKALNINKSLDLIYSDEDKLEMSGERTGPYFKSDFNIDLLRSNNYICHFTLIRKSIGDNVGWFTIGLEGSQDHDLILKVVDSTLPKKIHHIPKVLYHWRKIPGSTATSYSAKDYVFNSGQAAIENHLKRNNEQGTVIKGKWGGAYRIKYKIKHNRLVSIIIPFKDQIDLLKNCINSILEKTKYSNYEIILVDNNSIKKETFNYLKQITKKYSFIKCVTYNHPFNYSKMNNWAVQNYAKGNLILLLNNDIEVISELWLTNMVEISQRDQIGAVGAKLLYDDNTLQHAGAILGIGGVAGHAFKGKPDTLHYFNMGVIKNVGACTAACLLVKKELFINVGGLDEDNLKIAYNDIDLCLKIRQAGYLISYTPYSILYHFESKSRGYEDTPEKKARHDRERDFMINKWGNPFLIDPYYNPNFTLDREDYSLKI